MSNKSRETVADIVAQIRDVAYIQTAESPSSVLQLANRIEAAAKRGDDLWRAAFAKVTSVVSRQHAKRNLGEHGSRAVAEIMSACRFADGALDEYERAFAENARLRAALKPVLECRVRDCMFAECNDGRMKYFFDLIRSAQRIYTGGGESEVKK